MMQLSSEAALDYYNSLKTLEERVSWLIHGYVTVYPVTQAFDDGLQTHWIARLRGIALQGPEKWLYDSAAEAREAGLAAKNRWKEEYQKLQEAKG